MRSIKQTWKAKAKPTTGHPMANGTNTDVVMKLARRGDANAQFDLACLIRQGAIKDSILGNAFDLHWKAAVQGHQGAKFALIEMATDSKLGEEYKEDIYKWCREMAEQGDAQAQYHWHSLCGLELGDLDAPEAVKWLKKSVEQNYPPALTSLGMLHEWGEGVEKDEGKAIDLYRRAAALGDVSAQHILGDICVEGRGTKQDFEEGIRWLRKAISNGSTSALVSLGKALETLNLPQCDQEAVFCFQEALKLKIERAEYYLGRMYERGRGVQQDCSVAAKLYWDGLISKTQMRRDSRTTLFNQAVDFIYFIRRDPTKCLLAAENGNSNAQVEIGLWFYEGGEDWPKNVEKAKEWLWRAAKQGNTMGQFCWGCMVELEAGEDNGPETLFWFRKAANQGLAEAQAALGRACYDQSNFEESARWYQLAAEQGHCEALIAFGQMCEKGEGVEQDFVAAARCLRLANEWSYRTWLERTRALLAWRE